MSSGLNFKIKKSIIFINLYKFKENFRIVKQKFNSIFFKERLISVIANKYRTSEEHEKINKIILLLVTIIS